MRPNAASDYNPSSVYMAELVESTGLTQKKIAEILDVNERTVRRWVTGASVAPYVVQFALEALVLDPFDE